MTPHYTNFTVDDLHCDRIELALLGGIEGLKDPIRYPNNVGFFYNPKHEIIERCKLT